MINQTKVESTKSDNEKIRQAGRKLSNVATFLLFLFLVSALSILFVYTGATNGIYLFIFGGFQIILLFKIYISLSNAGNLLEDVGCNEDKN